MMEKSELAKMLREAKALHGEFEQAHGADLQWPDWYASYIVYRSEGLDPQIAKGWATIDHLNSPGVK